MAIELRGTVTLIEVADVPASIVFYREALGFEVVDSAGEGDYIGWAWLRHGNVELMLNAMFELDELSPQVDPSRSSAHGDTTIFIGCPDIDGAYAHLTAVGIDAKPPTVTHYGMKQVSFADPDGYGICLQWRAS